MESRTSSPAVSVAATVLNERDDIDSLITTLAGQTLAPAEIVIVDGGSTDGTWERLEAARARYPNLVPIRDPSCSLKNSPGPIARGRNVGIAAASSEVVACADCGCTYHPDWLARLTAPILNPASGPGSDPDSAHDSCPRCEYSVGGSFIDPANSTVWDVASAPFFGVKLNPLAVTKSCTARSMAFRKELWQRVGGFPETVFLGEDTAFDAKVRALVTPAFPAGAKASYQPRHTFRSAVRQMMSYSLTDGVLGGRSARLWRNIARCLVEILAVLALVYSPIPLLCDLALEIYFAFRLDWPDLRSAAFNKAAGRKTRLRTFAARLAFSLLVPWIVAWYQALGAITKKNRPNRQNFKTDQVQPTQPFAPYLPAGVLEVLACGITALVYVATLSFGFVYDDIPQILKNPAVHSWRFVPQYFTSHVWAAIYPNTSGNYYRPLFLLWLKVNYALFGTKAVGWHLTSVACHVIATWLVFRIAQQLTGDRLTAFLAALIFGLHPAHVENVAWISGVSDPLMACFLFGSFSAFLSALERRAALEESKRARATSREQSHDEHGGFGLLEARGSRLEAAPATRQVWYAALSLGLFAMALLSKETAIVLPVLIMAFVLIFERDFERDHEGSAGFWRRFIAAIRKSAPYLLLVLIYGGVRYRALGGWSHPTIPIGWTEVCLTWPAVLWFYARHLILPVRLSEFYSLEYVTHFSARAVLLPLAFLLIVAAAVALLLPLLRGSCQKNAARFALLLIVIPLLPVLDLHALTVGDIVHDRYLYLPSVGFALLIALLIRALANRLPEKRSIILPGALAAVVIVAFATLTVVQQMQWASDILLYTRGLESAPANLTVRDNLASALLKANQPARAIPLYLEVLNRDPTFWRSNYNLGFAYYKTGQFPAAEYYLQRAIQVNPADSDQYIYLALAQLELKKLTEAAENASRAIALSPSTRGYHFVLGVIYETAGDRVRAAAEFKTEIAEHPDNTAAAAALQKLDGVSSAQRP
ncbi:MAG: tetratricopeptide repeat protein [Terriglobales bacterium]